MELETLQKLIWLVPLLPFAGFLVNGFLGRRLPRLVVSLIGCGTVFGSLVVAVLAFLHVRAEGAFVSQTVDWIRVTGVQLEIVKFLAQHSLTVDKLTCVMMMVVTGVGFLIHLYSVGYMGEDKRYARYFCYLNLFTGFMLILVMASNLFLMFVGWEGVGLCSYLLIGFWFEHLPNAVAGKKAFLVNRVGDFSFTIGVLLIIAFFGTVDIAEIRGMLAENPEILSMGMATLICILLFGGATGKSAQIPLYVWLPDAMAGPTPVSALIHAATMVTAGVYMVARMGFLFALAPYALLVVAGIGCLTALYAGTIALCQNDIKKVLAYSTVSQLGFMFMGVGSGYFLAGIFHLMTHAFFKACLFLGSGSVIHGMGGEQDIRKMGGLFPKMKITAVTFIVASAALAGLPFVTAGFVSKETVLGAVWNSEALHHTAVPWIGKFLAMVGFVAAGFTAFYMTRLVFKTFFWEAQWKKKGEEKHEADDHGHGHGHGEPHESPWTMTLPLIILAVLSIIGGFAWFFNVGEWLGPQEPAYHHMVAAEGLSEGEALEHLGHAGHGPSGLFIPLSILMSIGGILLGYFLYWKRKEIPERLAERHRRWHELLLNKYYVDEAYQKAFIEPLLATNEAAGRFDNAIIDGAVNGAGTGTAATSQSTGYFDNEVIDGGVNGTGWLVRKVGAVLRRVQMGNIKGYLTGALVGGLFLIAVYSVYHTLGDEIQQTLRRIFG